MSPRIRALAAVLGIALLALPACTPAARPGSLAPTLSVEDVGGHAVAVQGGIPVPTFDRQARRQIDLDGPWRVERLALDADLSLTDRDDALEAILAEAAGREQPGYDDAAWETVEVPGSLNHPPDGREIGGWYRRDVFVPRSWAGSVATLKIGAANYVADVWVNGTWIGYHEGGYTPFAFDLTDALQPGSRNSIAIRVDNPTWGTRNDIVPWGLADWWNYGGLTGSAWIEATPPTHLVRADVVPHLDGIDVSVVVRNGLTQAAVEAAASDAASATPTPSPSPTPTLSPDPSAAVGPELRDAAGGPVVRIAVLPAEVDAENLTSPVAAALVPDGGRPLAVDQLPLADLAPGEVVRLDTGFLLGGVDAWSPARPALYVLRVTIEDGGEVADTLWTSFGIRHVAVNPDTGQLLFNGSPRMFTGVGLHDERIDPEGDGEQASAARISDPAHLLAQLDHASEVNADLLRAGHTPANPLLLLLADRLGYAVWEEIPLYHYTPLTYGIAMDRGIPQQMLREMALRDMNRPSVLFHGLSNESTGTDEREDALRELHEIDREIDGTRLTAQAAYGSTPDDPTHEPLDVAGFTFYYDVFYGSDAAEDTARALAIAHRRHPGKPVLALEFGRWADGNLGTERQQQILEETFPQLQRRSAERGGYVGAAVWWSLEDFTTMVPGIGIEHFGLYDQAGERRPSAVAAARLFAADAGEGDSLAIESDVQRAEVVRDVTGPDVRLLGYLAYGIGLSVAVLAGVLFLLLRRGGRAAPGTNGARRIWR